MTITTTTVFETVVLYIIGALGTISFLGLVGIGGTFLCYWLLDKFRKYERRFLE